jgi:hypothetical protein
MSSLPTTVFLTLLLHERHGMAEAIMTGHNPVVPHVYDVQDMISCRRWRWPWWFNDICVQLVMYHCRRLGGASLSECMT